MNIKSILIKSVATTSLLALSAGLAGSMNAKTITAAIVANDTSVVTVNNVTENGIRVFNNYEQPVATGQVLPSNTSWKVIKTAYDHNGDKWYDLGKNQWVQAKYVNVGYNPVDQTETNQQVAPTTTQTTVSQPVASTVTQNAVSSQPNTQIAPTNQQVNNTSGSSETSAKNWIASRESGNSYNAANGQYIGKYQLSKAYLHGDYSPANQERAAQQYVQSRYGSWRAAKAFWQTHNWY